MTDIKRPIDTLADQIGRDMRLLIGRISQLEQQSRDTYTDDSTLPTLPLPQLTQLPINLTNQDEVDLGFVDLRLSPADWSQWDLTYNGQDLLTESSLKTAILISVWTDARSGDQGGWWGDSFATRPIANSLVWTLLGKPATDDNIELGIGYVKQALQWLLDDKWITELIVTGESQTDPTTHLTIFAFKVDTIDHQGRRQTLYL